MWRKFNALIPYYGGKRGLCPLIFKEIARVMPQKDWPKLTLADGFSGGGSVSLYAKGQGMKVLSNDIADRSRIIMDSLIVNDRVMISNEDIHRLFVDCDHGHFVRDNFVPGMFMQKQGEFIDRALHVIARIKHHTKQQLLRLALIKYIVQITPFAYVHKVSYFEKLEFGDPDTIGEANRRKIPVTLAHPSRTLKAIQKEINKAVFPSGHVNEAHQRDVFEFLENVNADICYLDPPYAGAADYKKYYRALDQILAGRMFEIGGSEFNAKDAERVIVKMLEAAKKFRVVVVSYGSHRFGVEGFEKLVRSVFSNAEIKQIKFRYSLMRETKEKSEMRELLAVIKN